MKHVLVTGGAGYIGSVVCQTLLERGHSIVVLDSLEEGHRQALPPKGIFFQGDLGDESLLKNIFKSYPLEAVLHLAAYCQVGESVEDPEKYYGNNVSKGLVLLRNMRTFGIKKIVFSSTAAVYGEPLSTPIAETHPTQPLNPYGHSKLIFEQVLDWYQKAYGFKYVTFRYFNAAGAIDRLGEDHHPETHLTPLVLREGVPLTVFGLDYPTPDGSCIRDYIHVRDLALAHVLALERLDDLRERIFNLGNGQGFSVLEVIEAAAQVRGRKIPFRPGERRRGDPAVLVASSAQARKILGWEPQYPDLKEIIASAWRWHQKFPRGYES
ncbi:MAG: UDP-glucose 4-epimerase GalE [Deltaproteobacteria bacterium]|nr:UDP-glucose 4-epimerase GalE [Deltaproteobacteria bacterium]